VDKNLLTELYINGKKSSAEIAEIFGCSQHKVNYWINKQGIPKRSISEAIYQKRNPAGDPFNIKPVRNTVDAQFFGLGLGLYWGEGNKRNKHSIRLGNTDPLIIRKFTKFLVELLGVNKKRLRFGLQIFTDTPENAALHYWLKELKEFGINRSQFFKPTITPSGSIGTYKEKSKFGVMTVHFSNTKLKKILDNMIAEVAQR